MDIRKLSDEEIPEATALIWETFLAFEAPDYAQEGIDHFRDFIFDREITATLEFFGAFEKGTIKGVIATRKNRQHIACFFVPAMYQGAGIGRKLWEFVLKNSSHPIITVNSSPFAIPIYHRLGFEDTDSEQVVDGIRFVPMQFLRERGVPH